MKRATQYEVTFGPRDWVSFLDMLRYDGAFVVKWNHIYRYDGRGVQVTLEVENRQPSIERWASFGITAKVVS